MEYIHDSWCAISDETPYPGDECDCYVELVVEKDKRIEELEAKLKAMECGECAENMLECKCDD